MEPEELLKAAEIAEKFIDKLDRDFYRLTKFYGVQIVAMMKAQAKAKRDHIPSPDCWCGPEQDHIDPNVWIHKKSH